MKTRLYTSLVRLCALCVKKIIAKEIQSFSQRPQRLFSRPDNALLSEADFYNKIDKSIQQAENGDLKELTKEKQKEILSV